MTEKTIKQKINDFLCKHAQGNYVDKYGNVIRKPDGTLYKSGKVTIMNIIYELVLPYFLIILIISILTTILGYTFGNDIISYYNMKPFITDQIINAFILGIILSVLLLISSFIIYYILKIIYKILTMEVAKCPMVETPPERKKCTECGAPRPFENEKIIIGIKENNSKYPRKSSGMCNSCGSPILHENEEYTITIM